MDKHTLFSQKFWSFILTRHEEYKHKINQILLVSKKDPNFRLSRASNGSDSISLEDHTQTNVYAWKSDWYLHYHFPILKELCEDIKPYLTQIIKEEKIKKTSTIETVNCWINKYKKGDFARSHIHEPQGWSVIYFMNIPEGDAVFRVHNPLGLTYNSELLENFATLDLKAKEGSVIIMSGAIKHEATPNTSKEERTTIAMNFRMYDHFPTKPKSDKEK
jgi:hypothetical protein